MATIIDNGDGSYIAGDPASEPPADSHWCFWCGGTGTEYDSEDGAFAICSGCSGSGTEVCRESDCALHSPSTRE